MQSESAIHAARGGLAGQTLYALSAMPLRVARAACNTMAVAIAAQPLGRNTWAANQITELFLTSTHFLTEYAMIRCPGGGAPAAGGAAPAAGGAAAAGAAPAKEEKKEEPSEEDEVR